ncbi:MAG TPA: aldo/keto reductase [Candidatus Tectomicrobia bacterium]|jgi:aryl-alcohol dehydrogenase-like predicted oxidoreductase
MEYRQLGSAGVRISVIGLGTNRFGAATVPQAEVNSIIDAALDLEINFIDASNTYTQGQAEETLGQALKGRWEKFVVASKFVLPVGKGPNDRGASRYHMLQALEASLRRLQSDHIDLYYVHRWDPTTRLEETLRALDDLIRMGKVLYLGVSDFAAWQLAQANMLAELRGWTPLVVIQSEYNLLKRDVEREVLPYCQAQQVGFVPYYPLAGGFLTGKYRRGEPPPPGSRGETNPRVQKYMTPANFALLELLTGWAAERGRGLNELAQAWLLAQPQVCSVISGATRLEHVLSNAKAASWTLTPAEVAEVNALLAPRAS